VSPRSSLRRTPITIGVSLLLHVVVIGGLLIERAADQGGAAWWPQLLQPRPTRQEAPPEEIELILLDDPDVRLATTAPEPGEPTLPRAPAERRPTAPRAHVPRSDAPAADAPSADAPAADAPAADTHAPAPRSAFAMRAPGESPGVDVALPRIPESELSATPAPGVSPTRDRVDELDRQRDGTYRSEHRTFTARVAKDGRVRFDDGPSIRPGNGIDPSGPAGAQDPTVARDQSIGNGGVGGSMDITEMAMRRRGIDPHAHEKLAFLDRTRDERAAIAQEHRTTQLSKSGRLMRRTLDELWTSTVDPAERKQALFELWDECVETGDPEQLAGAQQARAEIMAFIRTRLHGPNAYTHAELARFNARKQSKATFAPPASG
jgi:hypothetical protein